MERFLGLLCALGAAVAFGLQYVPVKKYEIFDGVTFQWFMCGGILMIGFLCSIVFGNFGMTNQEDALLIIEGGALWALSNYLVLPLVKLLGIGLGFSLYHFVNLMVGYNIGRFGIFGMEPLKGDVKICDLGCCLVLVSFVLMVFVEEGDREAGVDADGVAVAAADAMAELPRHHSTASAVEDQVLREKYSRWREDHVSGRRRSSVMEAAGTVLVSYSTAETGGHLHSVGGFSVLQPPRLVPLRDDETGQGLGPEADHGERQVSPGPVSRQSSEAVQSFLQAASGEPSSLAGRAWRKAAGVLLALLAGSLTGVQSVPASLVNQRHKDAPATNVVFPQCLGIYICSSAIYLIYSAAAKLAGWRVPHSPIRPAYLSGCVWAVGFTFMISGISSLGFSIGYTLDAVGPIVIASLLSIFVFKEITDRHQLILYGIAFTLQVVGVICMSSASS